jgi:hypothetical protein
MGQRQGGLSPIALARVIFKCMMDDLGPILGDNIQRAVGTPRIYNEYLSCPIDDGVEARSNIGFFIKSQTMTEIGA